MQSLTWIIVVAAVIGVITRPLKLPEVIWAMLGAALLVATGPLTLRRALGAAARGGDVYLFLIGMMLLSEVARREGLFDWVASHAVNAARGSAARLFALIYGVGVIVTTFLSNDATAVVLTPAVFAAARKAKTEPLPYLFACAFVANAASFVLPISNPANIVLYGGHTPALIPWLARFALPSLLSIVSTYVVLRCTQRNALRRSCARDVEVVKLTAGAVTALGGLMIAALALVTVSAFDVPLGLPTALLGVSTMLMVQFRKRESPAPLLRDVSWSVLPLVAGLFVLVEALDHIGVIATLARWLQSGATRSDAGTAAVAGSVIAIGSNLVNNLPAGLLASSAVAVGQPASTIVDALLIGVDLGPNLSVTGSLATILWLSAIRREGENIGFRMFLRFGIRVMPPALILAIAARLLS